MLLPTLTGWRAQYDRLLRSRDRVLAAHESSVVYDDDLQHYFQDCWHLKDWLKNDHSIGIGGGIESEVNAHASLMIAADLANAAKHLVRTKLDRTGAYVTSTNVTVHLGQRRPIDISYEITLADGATWSELDLVNTSFSAWQTVLRRLGLDP